MKDIYNMELFETNQISSNKTVMRVPGGWVITTKVLIEKTCYGSGDQISSAITSVFVPFNTEFQQKLEIEDTDWDE